MNKTSEKMMSKPNKSLGQHWLKDEFALQNILYDADLKASDTVLEIGPGQGVMTFELASRVDKLYAVEYDEQLYQDLLPRVSGKNIELVNQDILKFNLTTLPFDYKVVANIPYYITNKIVYLLVTSQNKPSKIVLLMQKEVAEKFVSDKANIASIGASIFYKAKLGSFVAKEAFLPAPKVDSMVLILDKVSVNLQGLSEKQIMQIVKFGFASKRKKLLNNISSATNIDRVNIKKIFDDLGLDENIRAENLELTDWINLTLKIKNI